MKTDSTILKQFCAFYRKNSIYVNGGFGDEHKPSFYRNDIMSGIVGYDEICVNVLSRIERFRDLFGKEVSMDDAHELTSNMLKSYHKQ